MMPSVWPHPKGLGQANNMSMILIFLTLLGERVGKYGLLILMMLQPGKVEMVRNV